MRWQHEEVHRTIELSDVIAVPEDSEPISKVERVDLVSRDCVALLWLKGADRQENDIPLLRQNDSRRSEVIPVALLLGKTSDHPDDSAGPGDSFRGSHLEGSRTISVSGVERL